MTNELRNKVTIGCDPELFVQNRKNSFVSGYEMIPGTKEFPFPVDNGAVQVDGSALEFNTEPAETAEEFIANIRSVMGSLRSMIPDGYRLSTDSAVTFSKEYFRKLPREAKVLGCNPDYNAWKGGQENMMKRGADKIPFRTAAGHVHVGWTSDVDPFEPVHNEACRRLICELDLFLGLPSVILDPEGGTRRELYGKAGAFRPKPYGVEYRVLSNFWLKSDKLINWVYESVHKAFFSLENSQELAQNFSPHLQTAINNSDVRMSKNILMDAGIEVPNV